MPQVTKTMSAPAAARATSSRFSSIACLPISGRAPAPRPRVSFLPIWILTSDFEFSSACASVLTEMNSTPSRCSSIMRLTALPPPPPTPTTFMRAFCVALSSNSKIIDAETLHQIAGHMPAGELERRKVPDLSLVKNGHPGRAPPNFHKGDAKLFFIVGQHRVGRGERLEHHIGDPVAGALNALAEILRGRRLHRDEIHLHFEPRAGHADRIRNAALLVDLVFLGDVVQQLVIAPERDGPRHFVDAPDVLRRDLLMAHRDHPGRAARRDVLARDAAGHVGHTRARHALGVLERGRDGTRRLIDVAHHAAAHARVLREPDAEDLGERRARQIAHQLGDDGARLGASQVETGDEAALWHHALPPRARRRTITCPAKRPSSSA
jgi:hypothetical protein